MASPDIAPSVSPISIALLVPIACEEFPIPKPTAKGDFILNILQTAGATIAPVMPDATTDRTVIDFIPPILSEISIAIAVVTDFGSKDKSIFSDNPKDFEIIKIPVIPIMLPIAMLISITGIFALSIGRFLYIGRAKTTVAGTTKAFINFPPLSLYTL